MRADGKLPSPLRRGAGGEGRGTQGVPEFLGFRKHNRPVAPGLRRRNTESAKADLAFSRGEDFSPTPFPAPSGRGEVRNGR